MKRLLLLLLCVVCAMVNANAQDVQSNDTTYYAYGVDFSHVETYAAAESEDSFIKAFEGINMLFISEPDKYDFSGLSTYNAVMMNVEPMIVKNSNADYSGMKQLRFRDNVLDCSSIVKEYELQESDGRGIIFIAKTLDKAEGRGIYQLVVFDIATREIIMQKTVAGKASGFGLRNYWANTIYDIIKKNQKMIP